MNPLRDAVLALRSGDLETAERRCRQILAETPRNADALNLLGVVAGRVGKHSVAADLMQKSVSLAPQKPALRSNLATALLTLDKAEEAETTLKVGLTLSPQDPKLHALLATALGKQGRTEEAIAAMQEAVAMGSKDGFTYFNLAELYRRNTQSDEAVKYFHLALEMEPQYVDALNNLAGIHLDRGDFVDAMRAIQKALDINQRSAQAYTNLGIVMFAAGEMEQSLVAVRNALQIDPSSERARFQLANMLLGTGAVEEAEDILVELRGDFPDDDTYTAMFAKILERKGDVAGATEAINSLDDESSLTPTVAIAKAVIAGSKGDRNTAIDVLRASLAQNESAAMDGIGIHFALGEQLDKALQFDDAFRHFEIGNKNRRKAFFGIDQQPPESAITDRLIQMVSAAEFRTLPPSNSADVPIFIIGMPRSGTSLTEQILASHPKVFGAGELRYLQQIIAETHETDADSHATKSRPFEIVDTTGGREPSGFVTRGWPHTPTSVLDEVASTYMQQVRKLDEQAEFFTDKMPYNFFTVPLIAKIFPQAKIIHTRRHPLDTCLSCFFQNFTGGNQFAYRLDDLGEFYAQYLRWMKHCRQELQVEMLELDYESVVQDPQTEVEKLLDYCDLEWDDACLEFHKSKRIVRTASYQQVRNPIYTRSVNRWRNYENYIAPLVEALGIPPEQLTTTSPQP